MAVSPSPWIGSVEHYLQECDPIHRIRTGKTNDDQAAANIVRLIDPLESDLAAKLRIHDLANCAPPCCHHGLGLVVSTGHRIYRPWRRATDDEYAAIQHERGFNEHPVLKNPVAAALRHLGKSDLFMKLYDIRDKALQTARTYAGAFLVEKPGKTNAYGTLLRMIIDARASNAKTDKKGESFEIFSLETLLRVISNLSNETWYSVSTDLRHWFHQIPLPDRHKADFVMVDRSTGASQYWVPTATPMGWVLAPLVGQSATWGMVLAQGSSPAQWMSERKYDIDLKDLQRERLPSFIALRHGGGIFVLLDNILVVTPNRAIAEAWQARLVSQTDRFHAKRKINEPVTCPSGVDLVELLKDDVAGFEFLGIWWRHHSRRIQLRADEMKPDAYNLSSRRTTAGVVGKLLWWLRVRDAPRGGNDYRLLLGIYERLTPGESESWDGIFQLQGQEEPALSEMWRRRTDRSVASYTTSHAVPTLLDPVTYAAVDASGQEVGTGARAPTMAAVTFARVGGDQRLAAHPPVALPYVYLTIALGELGAILVGIGNCLRRYPETRLIVMATDSTNAKSWVEHDYAPTITGRVFLEHIRAALGERRLYLTYIPSRHNYADGPTRVDCLDDSAVAGSLANQPDASSRLEHTLAYLQAAEREARGLWSICGNRMGGQRRTSAQPEMPERT